MGSSFDNVITTLEGDDYVSAGAGNDRIKTGNQLTTDSHDDTDTAVGGPGNDTLHSLGGNDILQGGGGNDFLSRLNDGGGHLEGGPGNDYLFANTSPESTEANVPPQDERMEGGTGLDLIRVLAPASTAPPARTRHRHRSLHLGTPTPLDFDLTGLEAYAFNGGTWQVGDPADVTSSTRGPRPR